jgi:hypothetical protein
MKRVLLLTIFLLSVLSQVFSGTFYSTGSVAANTASNWNTATNGSGTSATSSNFTDGSTFIIQSGHSMTTNATWTLSGSGSTLQINSGGSITISNAVSVANIIISGTLTTNGALSVSGNWTNNGGAFNSNSNTVTFNGTSQQQVNGTSNTTFGSVVIATGSTLLGTKFLGCNQAFTLSGTAEFIQILGTSFPANGAKTISSTSTYVYNGPSTTSAPGWPGVSGINFGNLTISDTGTIACYTDLATISGNLIINNNVNLISGAASVSIGGNLQVDSGTLNFNVNSGIATVTVGGNVILNGGTLNTQPSISAPNFSVKGNWTTNSGATFIPGTTTVTFNGSGAQTINGTANTTFYGLTLSTANGTGSVTLSPTSPANNVTVTNVLTLNSRKIITGINTLTIGASGQAISRTSGWIDGNLAKTTNSGSNAGYTYTIGDANNYTPVTLAFTNNATATGTLTINTTGTEHPQIVTSGLNSGEDVNRYWTISNSDLAFTGTYSAAFNFINGTPVDVDAGATQTNFVVRKYNGSSWSAPTTSSAITSQTTASGLMTFGDFAIGQLCSSPPNLTNFNTSVASTCAGSGSVVTINSTSLGNGNTFTVLYNLSGANASASDTASITVVSNAGTFTTPVLSNVGTTNITITGIYGSTCGASVVSNNTASITVNALPVITLGSIPAICAGATSFTVPYTSTTANQYSVSGSGIVSVTNGSLTASPSSITVNLSSAASSGTIYFTLNVGNSVTVCTSSILTDSVTVNTSPAITVGTIPAICPGSTSFTIPYTSTTANQYSITGSGITSVTNSPLVSGPSSIIVNLSSAASGTTYFTLAVGNSVTGCASSALNDSVTISISPTITLGAIATMCNDSISFTIPYSSATGNQYSISGSGITTVTNGALTAGPSSINATLSAAGSVGTNYFTLTVSDSTTGCISSVYNDSVIINICNGNGSQVSLTTDTSFTTQMNQVFAHINKDSVPTGILLDYGMQFINVGKYTGTTLSDSTKTTYGTVMDIYTSLAASIISMKAGPAGSFYHPIYIDSIWETKRTPGVITLGGLYYQYAQFAPNAVTDTLITVTNNQLFDNYVDSVWQNPYQIHTVFAVSPSIGYYDSYGTYSLQAVFPSSLWLTNLADSVSSIAADFEDGNGFRTITPDQAVSLVYSNGGTKTWTFNLNLVNGTVLQSQTDITLDSASGAIGGIINNHTSGLCTVKDVKRINYRMHYGLIPNVITPITADASYHNNKASGYYTIAYSNTNTTGKLLKPLIVVEGFDPGNITSPENAYGTTNYTTFISSLGTIGTNPTSYSGDLESLIYYDYDIIYVDWAYSEDFIENNALLLEKIITTVNSMKTDINTPVVILGQSMGTLCARWALKDMENKGIAHHVRTFISWDGPQQGANVPIAYQYLSRQTRSLYNNSAIPAIFNLYNNIIRPIANGFVSTVNAYQNLTGNTAWDYVNTTNLGDIANGALGLQDLPSPREMLINYLNLNLKIDNSLHTAWQQELDGMGYPSQCTNIAVSNGSECAATESFLPGQPMVDISGSANTRFFGDILASIALPVVGAVLRQPALLLSSLPGGNSFNMQFTCNAQPEYEVSAQQYVGKISYTKNLFGFIPITSYLTNLSATSDPSILPYDYFPGGEESSLTTAPTSSAFGFPYLGNYNIQVNAFQPSFCFVPTTSALDIGKGTTALNEADFLTPYIGAFPPLPPKNSPFAYYTTAFTPYDTAKNNNEQHINIEARNGGVGI